MSLRGEYGASGGLKKVKGTGKLAGSRVTRVIKAPKATEKHTPSSYLADMNLTTEEKLGRTREAYPPRIVELLDIATTSHQKDCSLDIDQALFQPFPSEVVFQQFEPHHTYEFPLALRNNDKVARHIKITHEESPYFSVTCLRPAGSKVAPGMETTYLITFTPDEKKDYEHELVCITEREKFVVPVKAIGARALLDFPDEIHFSAAPVKYSSMKTILVRNVGNKEAKFQLETQHPFSVAPASATLAVNACMQISVDFDPQTVGDHAAELVVHYDTGEAVYTQLHGSANDVNVRLDRSSITLKDTFIGLSSQRSVTLHNRSGVVVHYQWKAFGSRAEEEMQREIRSQQLTEEELLSKEAFFGRCMHNPSIRDRLPILTRSLCMNRKKYLDDERFLYFDEAISIDPMEGDVWPNSQAEISVIFQPEGATSYSRVAYCDVTGRESRLPLKIRGEGIGPQLQLSFDTLDVQNVFVNSSHAYEVILQNKGDVEGVYCLVPPTTLFGPNFSFTPSSGVLQPGRLQAIQISFCSPVLGEFSEDFLWRVTGAPHPLSLKIRGVVIGPTFQFDVPQIKFGTISYGFLSSREVTLSNTSEIPMTYHLRVSGDPPTRDPPTRDSPTREKEFDIRPYSGTLPPDFQKTIKVNFTPSSVRSYSCTLVVDVAEAGRGVFSLPITAKAVVPPISLITPLLDFGRCFIRHPYVQNVELSNNSKFPVKYKMSPQDQTALTVISYSIPCPKGVIEPLTTLSIPLQVEALMQGEITTLAVFTILGSADPPLEVSICCIGEGPVISVSPTQLDWGVCPVLSPISKTVLLSNESLIPAEFECTLAREKTIFTVEPVSSIISPEEKLQLTVTALIDDCLKFSDKLTIVVSYGVSFTVVLNAEGRGTTVVSHPRLQPSVDLGSHFSQGPCQQQFTLTNRGRRVQALSWTTEGFSAAKLKKAEIEWSSQDALDIATKRSQRPPPELKRPRFQIIPDKFVLEPYQSQTVTLQGCSPVPQVVNERLLCHAIIGRNPHKEKIMSVDVSARFIAPLLMFSTQEILFSVQQPPGSKLTQHSQQLAIRSVSPLPVTAVLQCGYPFSLLSGGTACTLMELSLVPGEDSTLTVQYDSTYCLDKHTRIEEHHLTVAYKEHPQRDHIVLKSEVYFPNLHFETTEVNFGSILNDTETLHYVKLTNTSPLEVHYNWVFLHHPPVHQGDPDLQDEGVDMQSECETESLGGEESVEEDGAEGKEEVEEEGPREEEEDMEKGEEEEEEEEKWGKEGEGEETVSHYSVSGGSSRSESVPGGGGGVQEEGSPNSVVDPQNLEQEQQGVVVDSSGTPVEAAVPDEVEQRLNEAGKALETKRRKPLCQPWELVADPFTPISIEQIFDILPLHGTLLPGQSQQMQFTFYGHTGVATEVIAACRVEGGPTYQLRLSGEAASIQYRFSRTYIHLGKQLYDQVQSVEVVLYNSGKVDLDFCALGVSDSTQLTPGHPTISPTMGHIPALENQKLTIHYLPGTPADFKKTFQIQVAHFEPDTITLTGEGIFPCISFNLPREITSERYVSLRDRARESLLPAGGLGSNMERDEMQEAAPEDVTVLVPPQDLECEIERMLVAEFAQEHVSKMQGAGRKVSRPRPTLPAFHLDFGYVVYGLVVSRTLTLTNVGHSPVSFTTAHRSLAGTGFSVDLGEKVRSLPGAPDPEALEFTVRFDPAAILCPKGHVEARLPFNLVGGPTYMLKLSAEVTQPSMQLSSTQLDFGTVLCGQCRIITIRLHNPYYVKCEWTAITDKPLKKIPKHVPLHVRRKMREKPPPKYFEVEPVTGILLPGQRTDIRVRFMPSEELHYVERIPFSIRQNADSGILLHVEGHGSEPQVLFDHTLLEFPSVLPFSSGSEAEVTLSNPMPYPVEIYSLSFDQQYIDEEEVLRWLKDYDKQNRLFLPPITPGGKLPQEVLTAYERDQKAKVHSEKHLYPTDSEIPSEAVIVSAVSVDAPVSQTKFHPTSSTEVPPHKTPQPSTTALFPHSELSIIESISALTQATGGSLSSHPDLIGAETSPVAAAIARYMGIDLSSEAVLAENRRGMAVIVHGPPKSGRSTQALALGKRYSAAVLVMDDILTEAISTASTPAGCKARECCIQAVQARAEMAVLEPPSSLSVPSKKHFAKDSSKEKDKDKETQPEIPNSLPEQLHPFKVLPLEDSQFAVPEGELTPTTLPEDLIAEILADRLQHMDCRKGVVFDGIESQFTSDPTINLALILRAFHNRKHIYFVHITMELQAIQDRLDMIEKEKQLREEEKVAEKKEAAEKEQQRIVALLELEEDEYEALSEEQRAEIDRQRLEVWKEKRQKKRKEREEQERLERERREEEERRLGEEKSKRKGKKDLKPKIKPVAVAALAGSSMPGSRPPSNVSNLQQPSQLLADAGHTTSGVNLGGAEIHSATPKQRGTLKMLGKPGGLTNEPSATTPECQLEKKYHFYKTMLEGLGTLLEDWDRMTGEAKSKPPPEPEEPLQQAATPSRRKSRLREEPSLQLIQLPPKDGGGGEGECREGLGVPMISVEGGQATDSVTDEICSNGLPTAEEVLEGMGQGPSGPPLPQPLTLQVYPYPLKRRKLEQTAHERFVFIGTSPDDPNIPHDDPPKVSSEPPEDTHEPSHEKEPPSRHSKRGGSVRSMDNSDSGSTHRKSPLKSTARKKSSLKTTSPVPQLAVTQAETPQSSSVAEPEKPAGPVKLVKFRWVVPAGGKTKLKLLFASQDEGQFDQTLSFEIVGTRRRYQLFCRGLCVVPTICREPRIVFASRKKTLKKGEIVHKKFVLSEGTFVFGPLLCGKTRERYREGRYPENMETVTVSNTSLMEVEASFCFQYDHNAATFLLDPPTMTLQPGESKDLTMWAYPKSPHHFKDALVCCIRHNPDPVVFNVSCNGVEPELKVDKKVLEFKKVLLHRKQTNMLHLHNHTLLPVAWKLSGLETLGEEFCFSQDHGIVAPKSVFPLHVHFRAAKQVSYTKKAFKIEISDVEQIMGLMNTETVQIQAEAYDVALDISFPRGTDGGLDFQCIRVYDEQKLVVQLKNKGKYDIAYNFLFDSVGDGQDYSRMFTMSPSHSTLYPGEKAQAVGITFRATREVVIKDQPILKCQVIDAHVGEQGEVIANIPIRISVKAVFSKFFISPINDINFGAMVVNSRKSSSFTLENKGEFEFKYAITKKLSAEQQKQRAVSIAAAVSRRTKSREGGREMGSARSSFVGKQAGTGKGRVETSLRTEVLGGAQRLVLGMYTVNPALGAILAGQSQTITVDCLTGEKPGKYEEELSVEISDRCNGDPLVTYKICGEVLVPGINTADLAAIFEEHRICRQLGALGQYKFHEDGCVGVYGEQERRFVFKSVVVGQTSKARFKISNPNKIPCDVQVGVKLPSSKTKVSSEAFNVEPSSKVGIPAHAHIYATVTFRPTAMQSYSAVFEAIPDGTRGKGLLFELQGEGNLPQVAIVRPSLRNVRGHPLLLFRRLLLNHSQRLAVALRNSGTIPATVFVETLSGGQCFTVTPPPEEEPIQEEDARKSGPEIESPLPSGKCPPPVAVKLAVEEEKEFSVIFQPHAARKYRGELCLRIMDNQFENLSLQLVGEGYEDEVCIGNIRGEVEPETTAMKDGEQLPEDVEAAQDNHLHFGSIAVGEAQQVTFALSNHSPRTVVRFQWPSLPGLTFTPSTGHLHPHTSKDITVTLKANQPQTLTAKHLVGKIWKITFSQPLSQISDWDDRMKTVRWVNVPQPQLPPAAEEGSSTPSPASPHKHSTTPAKRKVVETEPEPPHSTIEDGYQDLELFASAVVDWAKYKCITSEVQFRDTLMYQSRVYSFPLQNTGEIPLSYEWVPLDSPLTLHPSHLHLDDTGSIVSEGGEVMPFAITPSSGQLPPGGEQSFSLRFSPLDVTNTECTFRCNIPNLDSSCSPLEVVVHGRSLMPYCHFDLEQSDYLTKRAMGEGKGGMFRAGQAVADPSSTRVIEFHSCGVGVRIVKHFSIINPTSMGYEFSWTNEGGLPSMTTPPPFNCLTPRGFVAGGKKYEIEFEYLPTALDVVESLWRFSIPSLSVSLSFLLVGHAVEPAVHLDRAYVSFKSMMLGSRAKETVYLLNNEPSPYHFAFVERSCHCTGHSAQLEVSPMAGVIPPNGKLPVEISFTAAQKGEYNFNLQCSVRRKPSPLLLNVKAEGYAISTSLSYTNPEGQEESLPVGQGARRTIDFGQVPVNEQALGQVSILNHGQYSFEYHWVISKRWRRGTQEQWQLAVTPEQGMVEPYNRVSCELSFSPATEMVLRGCEIMLEIVNGPSLPITLRGSGVEPQVDFSFMEFDFGPCFLHRVDMPAKRATLTITNNAGRDVSVNCLFTNQVSLSVEFESQVLSPESEAEAVVEFCPKELTTFCEPVVFEINGLSKKTVTIRGEGVPMKIELANPAQKVVRFGTLGIGECSTRTVKVINHSPISLPLSVSILPSCSVPALQQEGVLTVSPSGEVVVKPNGGDCPISVTFSPQARIPQFSEEVTVDCAGTPRPLFIVVGSCHGLEVTLDSDHVPFGAVVQHSQSTRRILMINGGEIGASFCWEKDRFAPDFSIAPVEGHISPGMEIPFDVMFHPHKLNNDVRYEALPCHITGSKQPLTLTLSGMCIEQIPHKEVLHFTTMVRTKESRQLTLHNKTTSLWLLQPAIDGEYWSGPKTLHIEPGQARHYELTYHPLTMTTESQKHQGSIFFPLPDGSGLLYNLLGTAEPPRHAGSVSQEIPSKTPHTELLPVKNWLRRSQRFRVCKEMIRPEKLDRTVSLYGAEYIDVPALSRRDYNLHFYSYKECSILAKITFRNEQTEEYLFYHVNFKSTPPGIMGTIELNTPVRKSISHVLPITNPLPNTVTVTTNTNIADINQPPRFILGAQSEGSCMFEYLPLKVGEMTGKLTLDSPELGVYQYELHLVATTPPPERAVHFTTSLGSSQQQQCPFVSYARGRTEFTCKVDSSDFHVEKSFTVARTEASVEVAFEPSHLGDTPSTLTISSPSGGDYTIPLYGHCLIPKPQGPFTIKAGSSISIPFKNAFTQVTQFSFSVDNPVFVVKASDTLKPRKTYNILVSYDAKQADPSVTKTGKLVVTSQRSARAGTHSGISWVYYLKGIAHT